MLAAFASAFDGSPIGIVTANITTDSIRESEYTVNAGTFDFISVIPAGGHKEEVRAFVNV